MTPLCCIAGCDKSGLNALDGKLYCYQHWLEEQRRPPVVDPITMEDDDCIGCDLCTPNPKCSVEGCKGAGIITEVGDGDVLKTYCAKHAWKIDRPDANGLRHDKAQWNAEDAIRAHGAGTSIDEELLPKVSETVYEQCKRELEEGRKKDWRTK